MLNNNAGNSCSNSSKNSNSNNNNNSNNNDNNNKWSLFDVVQGAYVSRTVAYFHNSGIFTEIHKHGIVKDALVTQIAQSRGYDPELFKQLLEFLYLTTDIIAKYQGGYYLSPKYASYDDFGHHIDKLLGTYGPPFDHLHETLTNKTKLGSDLSDDAKLTQAFDNLTEQSTALVHILLGASSSDLPVVIGDLGMGPGQLLSNLVTMNEECVCWGLDISHNMCEAARQRASQLPQQQRQRITIYEGDVNNVNTIVSAEHRRATTVLFGGSILNEFFRNGHQHAVSFLHLLRQAFADAPHICLAVGDYYGKLGYVDHVPRSHQHNLLHDVAQAVSAQGIPPPTRQQWEEVYHAGGWKIAECLEFTSCGMDCFLHMLVWL